MKTNIGKPWVHITYHSAMKDNMGSNMVRALVVNIIAAMLLIWVLMRIPNMEMKDTVLICLALGIMSYMTTAYLDSVWFDTNSM